MRIRALMTIMFAGLLLLSGSLSAQCRMDPDDLVPVIDRHNPFFTEHTWDRVSKTETARMDPMRLLVMKQKACLRHHVLFTMIIEADAIHNEDRFWISEMLVMLKRVYFNDPTYPTYKTRFEREFVRQFTSNGLNKTFTFPVDDRTFICRLEYGNWGAKIKLESIKYLLEEKVKMPGISRDQDDGWFRGKN